MKSLLKNRKLSKESKKAEMRLPDNDNWVNWTIEGDNLTYVAKIRVPNSSALTLDYQLLLGSYNNELDFAKKDVNEPLMEPKSELELSEDEKKQLNIKKNKDIENTLYYSFLTNLTTTKINSLINIYNYYNETTPFDELLFSNDVEYMYSVVKLVHTYVVHYHQYYLDLKKKS